VEHNAGVFKGKGGIPLSSAQVGFSGMGETYPMRHALFHHKLP
jgi:hypothetical protein